MVFLLTTLTSNHRKPKLTQWASINMQICLRCAMGEIQASAWKWTFALSTFKISGLVLNKDKFIPLKWLFFWSAWIFWADLGKFSSALVYLLGPPHNHFQDMSVSNANQTNPLEAKRCKFVSLDILITPNSTGMQPKSRVIACLSFV